MKKFMKGCGITAAIILVLGITLVTVGGCGGGARELAQQVIDGEFSFGEEDLREWFGEWDEEWVWNEEWETYDLNENSIFNQSHEVIRDVEEHSESFYEAGVTNLNLGLGGCEVTVGVSDDDGYHVSAENIGAFQAYKEGDTLYVNAIKDGNRSGKDTMSIKILVPADAMFEHVDMSLGAGDFTINNIAAKDMELEIGAGRLQADGLVAEDISCELGAGQVVIENAVTTGNVRLETGAGELVFEGSVPGDLTAECALGNMEITITGSTEKEHNYDLECAAGNLTAAGLNYAGLVAEKNISNGADSDYNLSCAMGNLTLTFE